MASNSSEPDPKVINSIVDRLKKQGLFDKFRKECLADVDTKPAYLNLRHRTEVAVARFLSTQTWHPALNKNQLRDSLRKHINESSMMSSGIDRVVEQVVNPKIYRVFKPQIDRVVCEFLGIDPDERERQLKLKDEEQRRQRMQMECSYLPGGQQPFPPGTVTPDSSYGVGSSPMIPSLLDIRVPYMQQGSTHMDSASPSSITPQMTVAGGSTAGGSTSVGGITYPPSAPYGFPAGMQYGYPTQTGAYPGMTQQGMLQYPLGYSATMPPGFSSTIPQYPMATDVTVAPPQPLVAAPVEVSPVVVTETKEKDRKHTKKKKPEPLTVEELLNIPLPPKTHVLTKGKTEKKEEVGRQSPVVAETKDDVKPKRETLMKQTEETKSAVVPVAPSAEKMEVEGQDATSINDVPETKQKHSEKVDRPKVKLEKVQEKGHSRDGQKRTRETSRQTNKTSDVKKPVDDSSGVSDTNDVKTESVKVEVEEDSRKVSSQTLSESTTTPEGRGHEEAKEGDGESKVYHFVWDNIDAGCISDATVSSVHTSDLSSFDDGSDMTIRSSDDDLECKVTDDVKVKETVEQEADVMSMKETGAAPVDIEMSPEVATVVAPRQKPRRLISLQYNYSDSEEEETREERKARIAREIEERYLRRQQRRAELEAKKKEREDEKAVEREQRRQRRLAVAATAQRKEAIRDTKDEEKKEEEEEGVEAKPRKRDQHRTKEKRKEELREQKVKEMRMALRRQRTRNRRYTSDEFTTFFTGNKCMRSNESYTKIADTSSDTYSVPCDVKSPPTPTQDEHFAYAGSHPSEDVSHAPSSDQLSIPIYEVMTPHMSGLSIAKFVHMTRSKTKQLTLDTGDGAMESGMPYSDVSSDALSFSGSSVDSKTHHSPSEGRHDLTSLHATASAIKGPDKSTGHSDDDTPVARVRRKSSGERQSSDSRQKQCLSSDTSSTTSSVESTKANVQRYAIADLYKPHHVRNRSFRHSSPPPTPSPTPTQKEPQVRPSATEPDKCQEKRKAPPIDEVDFGEAAKKSLQQISFGEAERRSKAIRQRFGQSARHEVRRASSSKSPGDRVERMPVREPVVPSGGTYWSARDEKYRDTLKSGSTHGSWQSTKSSSQDDDDDSSRSKGRPRSRSQSEWRAEDTPAKSDRKKRRKKRRKAEDSSCSGSEEYSKVSRQKRVSQSSSGSEDLDPYPASSTRGARPPGECRTDEDEPRLGIQREEGETSDSDDDVSMSDAANAQEVKYTSDDTGFIAENIYVSAQDISSVTDGEVEVSQAADGTGSVECGMEVTVGSVDTPLSCLQPTSVTETQELQLEQGEIQLEIWQGSSHWSLSVENVGSSSEMAPSVEVISVQEPVSDVKAGDQVEGVTIVAKNNQVSYDETAISCVDGHANKGQKRPQSPGSDGGSPLSAPAKRARGDSSAGASNEEVVVVVQTQGDKTSVATPTVEATVVATMCSPDVESEGFHTVENPPPIEPEQKSGEEQSNIMADVSPCDSSVSPEDVTPSVQAEAATDTRGDVAGDSLQGTDAHEDLPDASTDKLERSADMGQKSSLSPDSQEVSTADAMETSSPTRDGTDERVHAPEIVLEKSLSTPERSGESVLHPEKPSADQVSASFERSPAVADGTSSQSPVDRSPDEISRELDEILLLDEMTTPQVVTNVTAKSVGASEGEVLPPQSPGSVSLCGEEQQQSASVDVTEARPDVSPTDASLNDSDKVAPEAAGNEEVCETIVSSPCHDEGNGPVEEDVEMSSLHEDTEETAECARPTAVAVVSETPKSEVDSRGVDSELSDNGHTGKCEHDSDALCGEKDSLPDPPSPCEVGDGEQGSLQATDSAVSLDDSAVASKAALGDRPDASVPDTVESVAEVQTAPRVKEEQHQEQEADHEEEHVDTDDGKATSNDAKSVEGAGPGTSPCARISDAESSLDEGVSETSARGTETSDKKEDTQEVSDTETLTPSVSLDTQHVEAKSAEPKQDNNELRDTGRRKSRRSVAEQQKDAETSDGDTCNKSQPRQRSRDRSQSMSATPRETRGQRAGVMPPEGSTRESRKLRRPSTPPPTRSRQLSARSTGSGQPQQVRSSSVGRKPGKVVTPPAKAVTPPKGKKGKAGNTPMTRASRRKSEEASLPIAKRLRH